MKRVSDKDLNLAAFNGHYDSKTVIDMASELMVYREMMPKVREACEQMLKSHHHLYLTVFEYLPDADPENDIVRQQLKTAIALLDEVEKV